MMDSVETVQVYVHAEHSKMPHGQLKHIVKLPLKAGEEQTITMHLPIDAFMLYNENGKKELCSGHYNIYVGGQQPDKRSAQLTGHTVKQLRIDV